MSDEEKSKGAPVLLIVLVVAGIGLLALICLPIGGMFVLGQSLDASFQEVSDEIGTPGE